MTVTTPSDYDPDAIVHALSTASRIFPPGPLRDIALSRLKYYNSTATGKILATQLARSVLTVDKVMAGQQPAEFVQRRFQRCIQALRDSPLYQFGQAFGVPEEARSSHMAQIVAAVLEGAGLAVPTRYILLRCEECGPQWPIPFSGDDAERVSQEWYDEHTVATRHTVHTDIEYK